MRLFVSIDFKEELREELSSWIPELTGWKKTPVEQVHLTLVFIGECTEQELKIIHKRLQMIRFPRFSLEINNLGTFPNTKNPRILWAGVSPDKNLMKLQKQIADLTESFQDRVEKREYVPHVTLARKKRNGKVDKVRDLVEKPTYPQNAYIQEFNLKQSLLKPSGSEHQILYSYAAEEPNEK
ncbi:MAG: RNA 2',3'-cyclic phosphodiesterase [Bacteroidetes bacterium]|jgi:2'-5' RNA ligase|nr:RNA 2',3'-cyclic phosphodiesterase [Bacteroidota bacterium]